MTVVEHELHGHVEKDDAYLISRIAEEAARKISENHKLPEKITLKITDEPQESDALINYGDWKIVVDYSSMNVQKELIDREALRGLLAHEIMHIAHKIDGTEDKLIKLFTESFVRHGQEEFGLVKTLGMITKDIIVNDDLIDEGFAEALFSHYDIVIHSRIKDNVFTFAELTQEQLNAFFSVLLGLYPSYASFYRKGDKKRGEIIKASIKRHFVDIPSRISTSISSLEASLLRVSLTEKSIDEIVESVVVCYSRLLGD